MGPTVQPRFDWRIALLGVLVLGSFVWVCTLAPIPQDPTYHAFADQRSVWGVPNFFGVVSNGVFLIAGLLGIRACSNAASGTTRPAWRVLFAGIALVGIGSGYYHLNPTDGTLVWDRLPMAVGFMGFFVALIGEFIDARVARVLLPAAVLLGAGTVFYGHAADDLRFYAWVQFMPLVAAIPLIVLFRSRLDRRYLVAALVLYAMAKVADSGDIEIWNETSYVISGHTLKHLLAGSGCLALVWCARTRRPE